MFRDLISSADATGDTELVEALVKLRGRTTHTVAAAVIDLGANTTSRHASLTVSKPDISSRPTGTAPPDRSRFEIGSVTKALTGMLLAEAIRAGELTLDTEIGAIFRGADGRELGSVTMRELCSHRSGLPRLPRAIFGRALVLTPLGLDPYRGHQPAQVLQTAAGERLRGRGGFRYSNLGGAITGQLLALAASEDYETLLHDRIFAPLGMRRSTVASPGNTPAIGRSPSGLPRQTWILDGYAPAGGVISTIEDLALLVSALLDGSAPGLESLQQLDGVPDAGPDRRSGMFWVVERIGADREIPMIWHDGATGGYSAFLGLFPRTRRGVVVLANVSRAAEQRRTALGLMRVFAHA